MDIDSNAAARRLRALRDELKLSQGEVGLRIGVHKSTVLRWEKGEGLAKMKLPVWNELAKIYNTTPAYLMYGETDGEDEYSENQRKIQLSQWLPSNAIHVNRTVDIPILGAVRAGCGGLAEQEIIGYSPVEISSLTQGESYFWLRVEGDSMMPKIESDDLVLVRQQRTVDSGSYAVVLIDGDEGLVKMVKYGKRWIELHSINPYYPVRRFEDEDIELVSVVGLVVEIKRRLM